MDCTGNLNVHECKKIIQNYYIGLTVAAYYILRSLFQVDHSTRLQLAKN